MQGNVKSLDVPEAHYLFLAYRLQLPLVCITVVMTTTAERKRIRGKTAECSLNRCPMQWIWINRGQ